MTKVSIIIIVLSLASCFAPFKHKKIVTIDEISYGVRFTIKGYGTFVKIRSTDNIRHCIEVIEIDKDTKLCRLGYEAI